MGKMRHLGMKQAPNKSTLSYANAHRPWQMFRDLFYQTLETCKKAAPGNHRFRFKNKLLKQEEIVLLTNHFLFGASIVAAIYKDRWQIELFFKALKQNLKVKTFVGTSENALYIQIWTALIAMLLIKYLQFKSKFGWSLSNLVAFLRWNLFTYRDLWDWINQPFEVLPLEPESVQDPLPLPGLGQQWPRISSQDCLTFEFSGRQRAQLFAARWNDLLAWMYVGFAKITY